MKENCLPDFSFYFHQYCVTAKDPSLPHRLRGSKDEGYFILKKQVLRIKIRVYLKN